MARKVLLIGWDGATFDIIEPLVTQNRLPTIGFLMQNGVWGKLKSTTPPLTPIAWTSISTGVNPGKHGIYDAMAYFPGERKIGFVNATMRKVKPIWSILSDRGLKVGVMNVPVTYPPDEVNGFVIPGMFTPDGLADFIYPSELQTEIENQFGKYMIESKQDDNPSAYLKLLLEMIDFREKVAAYLIDHYPSDFIFVTFIASDRVQHFFWEYLDTSHPEHQKYGEAIALVYERMDQALGRLLERVGSDATVAIVSDHGSGPLSSAFFLNNWLIKNGFLYLKEDLCIAIEKSRSSRVRSDFVRFIKKVIPPPILSKIKPKSKGNLQEELNLFYQLIDWERTIAFSEGVAGGIYINPNTVKPEQDEKVFDTLIRGLYDVTDGNGKKVVKNVYRRDEIYNGNYVKNAPDLIVICGEGYQIISPNEFLYFNKKYEDTLFIPHRWSARHEQYGIFMLKGPGVKKKIQIEDCRIIDVTPTLLYLMNEPIPEYMDGKVLNRAIEQEYILKNPVCFTSEEITEDRVGINLSKEEEEEITKRLKSLGYLE
jgi:predicted AlkP superfamily phosphohydrolase/phosphomutase